MSKETPEMAAAGIEAERARARLMETARELQERLSPAVLAQNAWEGAKSKGADLAEDAVDAVRRRPAIAGGIAAAIALFLAREPLIDMAGKLADGVTTKRKSKKAGAGSPKKAGAGPRKTDKEAKKTETIE
ncbi:DUF3618 domain-containing protein [Sphingomonas sp.]|uniref:DUF3618 domain-containing protein n=1 Tax=Sphingomonas sp. TaxID=28214 RepID=UPI0017E5D490|nr:DUF3618 domain-containing protein [Sphingomonas sp.]MBA3510665.1 DUF3618 domain-containing protein [Sphingomonas sp.]